MPAGRAAVLDLGGTRLKAGVAEVGTGRLLVEMPPRPSGPTWEDAREAVAATVADLRRDHQASAVGLAVPGVVDRGRITSLPGKLPGAEGADVSGWLASLAPGCSVAVANDAVAAGVGEAVAGAGAGHRRVVVVTIGTGVGVCVVEDGRPLGQGPFGGGILGGQLPVGDDHLVAEAVRGWVDTAGRAGTIEARCRTMALVAHGHLQGGAWWESAEEVLAAMADGDAAALAAVEAYRCDLARAVAALAFAHAPGCVVVAGGLAEAGPVLLEGVSGAVRDRLAFGLEVEVARSRLGPSAALAGLALLVDGNEPPP